MNTTLEREQAQRVYDFITTDLVLFGLENGTDVSVECWNDLHEYADPNQYLVDALGEDVLADAIERDDFSAFEPVMQLVDVLLTNDPVRFLAS